MDKARAAAAAHIRVMEARIKKQAELIEELKKDGRDPSTALKTLNLLRNTLEEMRLQIAHLVPHGADQPARRSRRTS